MNKMETGYSEWKNDVDAQNQYKNEFCPYCQEHIAHLQTRYFTNRDMETEKQYRVECPVCKHAGKVYLHESVARISWLGTENDPDFKEPVKPVKKWYYGR